MKFNFRMLHPRITYQEKFLFSNLSGTTPHVDFTKGEPEFLTTRLDSTWTKCRV